MTKTRRCPVGPIRKIRNLNSGAVREHPKASRPATRWVKMRSHGP
jgi:hypothetical protein